MKNKIYKITSLLVVSLLLCFVTYKLCYFIAETYFFDKFFYQKSTTHGYWLPDKNLSHFDTRSKDLVLLISNNHQILGVSDDGKYKIAVIGDSYVWGLGVKDNQRFTNLLQDKLNQIRPTKVYSFGNCGDNIFDDYLKYKKTIDVYGKIDLYIFALLENDLVFNTNNIFETNSYIDEFKKECNGPSFFDPQSEINEIDIIKKYYQSKVSSFDIDSKNYCVYKETIKKLPKNNSIYIYIGDPSEKNEIKETFIKMISHDLNAIIPSTETDNEYNQRFNVSKKEGHPSISFHKYFADTLFNVITSDPQWNFKNEK